MGEGQGAREGELGAGGQGWEWCSRLKVRAGEQGASREAGEARGWGLRGRASGAVGWRSRLEIIAGEEGARGAGLGGSEIVQQA